jgi:hypothetical protein
MMWHHWLQPNLEIAAAWAILAIIGAYIVIAALRHRAKRKRRVIPQSEFNDRLRKMKDD